MTKEIKIVTLCGSTRYKPVFEIVEKELALQGYLVITVSCWGHVDDDPRIEGSKELLDYVHLRKIDLADIVYVIDYAGYIGESTMREIAYAEEHNKEVKYLSDDEEMKEIVTLELFKKVNSLGVEYSWI